MVEVELLPRREMILFTSLYTPYKEKATCIIKKKMSWQRNIGGEQSLMKHQDLITALLKKIF